MQHLKHYNAGTRRDAISGLRELLDAHWSLLDSALAVVLNACARVISDEVGDFCSSIIPLTPMLQDAGVRKVLLGLFTWILPRIPQV